VSSDHLVELVVPVADASVSVCLDHLWAALDNVFAVMACRPRTVESQRNPLSFVQTHLGPLLRLSLPDDCVCVNLFFILAIFDDCTINQLVGAVMPPLSLTCSTGH